MDFEGSETVYLGGVRALIIAICSQGEGLDAEVDSRFGRCPYFVIVDLETDRVEATPNPAVTSGHGAGPKAAQHLADKNVEAVCAHHVGPNAWSAMNACGIDIYTMDVSKTVGDVVADFQEGRLKKHGA